MVKNKLITEKALKTDPSAIVWDNRGGRAKTMPTHLPYAKLRAKEMARKAKGKRSFSVFVEREGYYVKRKPSTRAFSGSSRRTRRRRY